MDNSAVVPSAARRLPFRSADKVAVLPASTASISFDLACLRVGCGKRRHIGEGAAFQLLALRDILQRVGAGISVTGAAVYWFVPRGPITPAQLGDKRPIPTAPQSHQGVTP